MAIETVQQLGGRIGFDFQYDRPGKWKNKPQQAAPVWLRRAIGEDYFRRVVIVNFDEGSDPSDDDLSVLQDLPDLRELTLADRTRITDKGLRNLSGLRRLQVLVLSGTQSEGRGLAYLRSPQRVEGLALHNAPITDEALAHVGKMSSLKWLILSGTRITDNGLVHLSSLRSLEDLQIHETAVADKGLRHLESIGSLKRVLLDSTQTTADGRASLRRALPNCKVSD